MTKLHQFVNAVVQKTSAEKVLNFWTLRFVDPQLEKLFKVENEKGLRRKRVEAAILSTLLLLTAVYLITTSRHTLGVGKVVFYGCMILWTICPNVLLFFETWQRHSQHIFSIFPAGCALFLIVELLFVLDSPVDARDYQSGFASLVIIMLFSILRVTYYLALIAALFVWFVQLICAIIVSYGLFPWYKIFGFTLGIASAILISGCAGYFIELKHRSVLLHKQILSEESERLQLSCNRLDKLLLNIFPKKIVSKLKKAQPKFKQGLSMQQLLVVDRWGSGQAVLNHHYHSVSVLLVDIVGFTPLSSVVAPRAMVSILNNIFSSFDDILEAYSMEKVRTIGDAYLCVGNMTKPLANHQEMAVRVGWQMLQYIKMLPLIKGVQINLRVGISCGPISAGVVGTTKWNYDIFGTTYSEAIAAEGASIPGHIAVTAPVYNSLSQNDAITFERMDTSGPERYIVTNLVPLSEGTPPLNEEKELEADSPDLPTIHTPRHPLSLRILLPSDFGEDENIEITVSDASSPTPSSTAHTPLSACPSPSSLSSGVSTPNSPRGFTPNSPTRPHPSPPFLSPQLPKLGTLSAAKRTVSVTGLRDRTNDFELRDLDLTHSPPNASSHNFAKLRNSHFFKELMRKHGVSNPEYREYAMGAKRYNIERELLEKQETKINRGVLHFRFSSPLLEEDFWNHFLRNAQRHLSSLSFCIAGAIVMWLLSDLLSSPLTPQEIPIGVWINFCIAAICSCLFGLYIRSTLYHHWTSKWISMLMMFVIGIPISLVTYYDHKTIYHFYHMYTFLCICFLYTRVWVVRSMVPVSALTVVSMYLCFAYIPARTPNVYRRNILAAFACCVILSIVNFIAYVGLEKMLRKEFLMTKLIQNEFELHQRTNETTKMLVRNILPSEIASRLCAGHKVSIVDHIPAATIMFIGIPNLYSSSKPANVFYLLNDIYTLFDDLTLACGLEKIKAVNSTYMIASGVPKHRSDHIMQAIILAKQIMQKMTREFKSEFLDKPLDVRVGIASGDVVAAIVGKRKYTYDCWSDCVNTAARMESHGIVGKIQVTENVYLALKHELNFEERGEINVKGKGMMKTYLLDPFE